jgi:hypothetical protein
LNDGATSAVQWMIVKLPKRQDSNITRLMEGQAYMLFDSSSSSPSGLSVRTFTFTDSMLLPGAIIDAETSASYRFPMGY